jgi:hypothetical protein
MKHRILSILAVLVMCGQGGVVPAPVVTQDETEAVLMRVLAKYSTVFRLVPIRISQMLQVITSYPATHVHARADLLQLVIQRMHEKYRTLQQLQSRVTELAEQADKTLRFGVYARSMKLLDALKKNQITLISTLSVLDAECVRTWRSANLVKRDNKAFSDRAYVAAKEALKPNQMDTLIGMLASGESGLGETSEGGSVKQEIRKLRDEVVQLSAQLQAKSLIEGAGQVSEKPFEDRVRDLADEQLHTVRDAQAALAGVEITEPVVDWKKYSLRYLQTVPGALADAAATLRDRARVFHDMLYQKTSAAWGALTSGEWYSASKDAVVTVWDAVYALVHRIFQDAGKAADHVAVRATEATESMPQTAGVVTTALYAVVSWIVESWISLGHRAYALIHPLMERGTTYIVAVVCTLSEYMHNAYEATRTAVAGSDDAMRDVACAVCVRSSAAYKAFVVAASDFGVTLYQKARALWAGVCAPQEGVVSGEGEKDSDVKLSLQDKPTDVESKQGGVAAQISEYARVWVQKAREYGAAGAVQVQTAYAKMVQAMRTLYTKAYASFVAIMPHEAAAL